MSDLVAFLLARLDEDDRAARAANPGPWDGRAGIVQTDDGQDVATSVGHDQSDPLDVGERMARTDAAHIARHDPARVLAEVAAKRRIVHLHAQMPLAPEACATCSEIGDGPLVKMPCPTLRLLALPHAEHADYLPEWAP